MAPLERAIQPRCGCFQVGETDLTRPNHSHLVFLWGVGIRHVFYSWWRRIIENFSVLPVFCLPPITNGFLSQRVDNTKPFDTICPFYYHGLTLIPAWISNYTDYNVRDEITYPFLNFNGATVEVWEWISNFTPCFTEHMIIYPCWDKSKSMLV